MAIFSHDLIGIQINQFGVYEEDALDILFEYFLPLRKEFERGLALDIGANIEIIPFIFQIRLESFILLSQILQFTNYYQLMWVK